MTTAVYTLAQSCLTESHPISSSPTAHHHYHQHQHHHQQHQHQHDFNSSSGNNRRTSFGSSGGISPGGPHHYTHMTPLYAQQEHQQQHHSVQQQHQQHNLLPPVASPVLSVSPPKHRAANSAAAAAPFSSLTHAFDEQRRGSAASSETQRAGVDQAANRLPADVHAPSRASTTAATVAVNHTAPESILKPAPTLSLTPLPSIHSLSVIDTFAKVLSEVDIDECDPAGENAFLVCDIARVWEKYLLWQRELGDRVEAFFAVKCNPDPAVVRLMAALGLGFDCASHQEIATVLAEAGVDPRQKIIYANPCKAASFIRHAAKANVEMMTFDNADELIKVKKFHPNAKMVLRILTDDSGSLCKLGLKFGTPLSEVRSLLEKAKLLKVNVIGISFHVGSGCTNPNLFADAVERAKWAFGIGQELGFNFTFLDVGGGFGGDNFIEIASILRPAIEKHFPKEQGIRIIAEPGRYFVADAFEMATNVIARRGKGSGASTMEDDLDEGILSSTTVGSSSNSNMKTGEVVRGTEAEKEEETVVMYYINDGVYGAFNCTMFDHQVVHPKVLTLGGSFISSPSTETDEQSYEPCSIWGPTCDSIDCVSKLSYLPTAQVTVGDWLRWENMGAYTICAASQFNGFKKAKVVYTIDAEPATEARIRQLLS